MKNDRAARSAEPGREDDALSLASFQAGGTKQAAELATDVILSRLVRRLDKGGQFSLLESQFDLDGPGEEQMMELVVFEDRHVARSGRRPRPSVSARRSDPEGYTGSGPHQATSRLPGAGAGIAVRLEELDPPAA